MTFDEFWQAYPRHLGKHEARKAFAKIPLLLHNELMVGLVAWCGYWENTRTEAQYIPYPATWLNKRRWEDKPMVVVRQQVGVAPAATVRPEFMEYYRLRQRGEAKGSFQDWLAARGT